MMQGGRAYQTVFDGGVPNSTPDPEAPPTGAAANIEDRTPLGANFIFVSAVGHNHWHFQNAALYQLLVPGRDPINSAKIGFCMYDTWYASVTGAPRYYAPKKDTNQTWCNPKQPGASFTREGISPHWGDLYAAQTSWQWVVIDGVTPGTYKLRATVNPTGYVDESNTTNNVVTVNRAIPGTIANPSTQSVTTASKTFNLTGKVIAPTVPALRNGNPCALYTDMSCYIHTTANGPLTFTITQQPAHGHLAVISHSGLNESVKYTPNAGFTGSDTIKFKVEDGRNLTSTPATVTLNVSKKTQPALSIGVTRHHTVPHDDVVSAGGSTPNLHGQRMSLQYKGIHGTRWWTIGRPLLNIYGRAAIKLRYSNTSLQWWVVDQQGHLHSPSTPKPQGQFALRWVYGGSATMLAAISRAVMTSR
jgi:hypothetical protein